MGIGREQCRNFLPCQRRLLAEFDLNGAQLCLAKRIKQGSFPVLPVQDVGKWQPVGQGPVMRNTVNKSCACRCSIDRRDALTDGIRGEFGKDQKIHVHGADIDPTTKQMVESRSEEFIFAMGKNRTIAIGEAIPAPCVEGIVQKNIVRDGFRRDPADVRYGLRLEFTLRRDGDFTEITAQKLRATARKCIAKDVLPAILGPMITAPRPR